jgi:hypothetical protein
MVAVFITVGRPPKCANGDHSIVAGEVCAEERSRREAKLWMEM